MRVLHVFKTYYPDSFGGIEQVIHQIAQETAKHGVKSDILSLSNNPKSEVIIWQGERIHQAKCNFEIASTRLSVQAIRLFKDLVKEVDLIHYQFPWPYMDFLHFITRVKKPTVVTYQSDIVKQKYLHKLYSPLQNAFLNSVNKIVATSPAYVESSSILPHYKDKIQIIPNGIAPYTEKLDLKKQAFWQQKCGEKFFLFVGVLRYYKGLFILLEAMKGLNYPLVIVGSGHLEKELHNKAKELDLKNIYFVGPVNDEDKFILYSLCKGFVFPSHLRSEAFGVALLEAAMMGKPLISCEIQTGTSYINQNDKTGWVVKPSCPISLRAAIKKLWASSDEVLKKLGDAAKVRYEELFTAEKMGKQYAELYKQLLKTVYRGAII